MQKGPKHINLQREGLDTEEIYKSKAYNRQKLHKQSPDTEGTKTFTSKAQNRHDLHKQSPDTWNLHKQGPHTDRTYTNRAKTPSKFK